MPFTTITKQNVLELDDEALRTSISHYQVIEANALQAGPLARGIHRRTLARNCGDAKFMLENVLWPEQDRRRRAQRSGQ